MATKVKVSAVETELLKATGEKAQAKGEDRQKYLTRLGKAVNDLEEEDYDALSEEATDWYESAVKSAKSKKAVPDFEGAEEEQGEEEEQAEKPAAKGKTAAKAPAGKAKGKTAAKAPSKKTAEAPAAKAKTKSNGKAPAKKAAKQEGTKRGDGVKPRLYAFLKGGGKGTAEQIAKKLNANVSTVRTKLSALGSKEWCIGKPLNIKRDEGGIYHL